MSTNMTVNSSDHYLHILGERLERSRLLRNVPQSDLAKQAGISARTLRRFESGEGGSLESFVRLLMALGLDDNLAVLIPDHSVRPIERVRQAKTERQRASRSAPTTKTSTQSTFETANRNSKSSTTSKPEWKWGDESS